MQDALIRPRTHWSRLSRRDDPAGYVRTTMTRLHVSAWRRREWLTAVVPEVAVTDPGMERVDAAGVAAALRTAFALLPPKQRAPGPLAGYENLVTDGTAWASGPPRDPATGVRPPPAVYKHLVTGEERRVRPASGVDAAQLRCVPAFCVAPPKAGGDVWSLQRPDGSQVTRLPTSGPPGAIGATADGGLIVLADGVLLDPISGRYGIPALEPENVCPQRSGAVKEGFVYRWSDRKGGGCGPPQVTVVAAGN